MSSVFTPLQCTPGHDYPRRGARTSAVADVEMCICKVCFGAPYATMAIAMRYKDEVDVVPFWLQLILGL